MLRAVLYDADGMLLKGSGTSFSDSYAKEFGIPRADMDPFFQGPFKECRIGRADLKEILVEGGWLQRWRWRGSVDELLAYWFAQGSGLNADIVASIGAVRARGVICVLCTNQETHRKEFLMRTHDLRTMFDALFVSSDLGCAKPEPAFFDHVMKYLDSTRTGIRRDEVLFWDDRPVYRDAGEAYGFDAMLFTDTPSYLTAMRSRALLD